MGKQIIACLTIFLLTLYWFFFYEDKIVMILLLMELLYFVLHFFLLEYLRRKIEISLETLIPIAEKGQEIPIGILVRNLSIFPSVHVKAVIQVENSFTGERKVVQCEQNIRRERTQRMEIVLKANDCGNVAISLKKCCVYDFLLLLRRTWKGREVQYVGILPECHLLPVEVTRKTREFIVDDSLEYSDRESGDDPSEIYQIREYREKDALHDIHWKLSAKADDLLVKEHGRPLGCVVLIWLDLQIAEKGKKQIPPTFLEAVASLAMSLLEEECVHMVAWYESENQRIQKKRVSKEEHIYELLNRLLYLKPYEKEIAEEYEDAFRGTMFSTVVSLKADGKICINQEEKMKLSWKDPIDWEQLYFIV